MVIEKARLIGNCSSLKSNYMSVRMMGMRGISTTPPFDFLFRIVASMTFGNNSLTTSLVPLHNQGRLMSC